jgi:hypothetical protein
MCEPRNETKILSCYFIVTADLHAQKGRTMREVQKKKTVNCDDGTGN